LIFLISKTDRNPSRKVIYRLTHVVPGAVSTDIPLPETEKCVNKPENNAMFYNFNTKIVFVQNSLYFPGIIIIIIILSLLLLYIPSGPKSTVSN
jgi:hypothetical protein